MAKQFNYEVYVKNLPDSYRKSANSNNHKILTIEKQALNAVKTDVSAIFDCLDIWQATGKTLDLYGEMYNVTRSGMDDDEYRLFILLKLVQVRAGSDHTSIVNTLAATLGMPLEVFAITDSDISGNVDVDFPYTVFQEAGIGPKRMVDALKEMLGAGIGIGKFKLSHDVPDAPLKIATAIVYGDNSYINVHPTMYVGLDIKTYIAPAITLHEINELEVI